MKAVAVYPGKKESAHLREVPRPEAGPAEVLVRVVRAGLDGTDFEINDGLYGEAPPGQDYLIIGHESLGVVEEVGPEAHGFEVGDMVVGTVRRPGGCINCRAGEADMCIDGDYTERGIYRAHGYLVDYYVEAPDYLVKLPSDYEPFGVLLEPMTIAEKGIFQAKEIQRRMVWEPSRAVVLGGGPLGLLATMLLRNRGLETYTVGREDEGADSPMQRLLAEMGSVYLDSRVDPIKELGSNLGRIDLIFEATGNSAVVFDALQALGANGVMCLTGLPGGDAQREVAADEVSREMVLGNKVVFGSVNANRRDFEKGVERLGKVRQKWPGLLERFITRRLPVEKYEEALTRPGDDVKTVLEFHS